MEIPLLVLAYRNILRYSSGIDHTGHLFPVFMAGAICPLALSAMGREDERLSASADQPQVIMGV